MGDLVLLFDLAVIVFMAKVFGEAALRMGLPSVFGEIVAGLVCGPNVFGRLGLGSVQPTEFLASLSSVALVVLLFRIGLGVNMRKLAEYGGRAFAIASAGVVVTFVLGYLWGASAIGLPPGDLKRNVLIGVILTSSSVGISARVLADMECIEMAEATLIIEAAVVDDVLGLLLFALTMGWLSSGRASLLSVLPVVVGIVLFLWGAVVLGRTLLPFLITLASKQMESRESELLMCFAIAMFAGVLAEFAGLAAIAGALLVGILLAESHLADKLIERLEPIYNLFVPIFFFMLGVQVDLSDLGSILVGAVAVTAVAVASKVAGCGLGALLCRLPPLSALRIGVGMVPRAEVPLVIASIAMGLSPPLISRDVFSIMVVMTLTSTLAAAVLLKRLFTAREPSP